MDGRIISRFTVWVPRVAVVLALCAAVLTTGRIHAQQPIQPRRRARLPDPLRMAQPPVEPPRAVMVPAVIRGQAVESAVINGVVLVFGELPVAAGPAADDLAADEPPRPKQRVIVFSGSFDELVYGSGSNAADARASLDLCLEQKLEKLDRISGLTDAQRQKLQLAGRGDLKPLFDR